MSHRNRTHTPPGVAVDTQFDDDGQVTVDQPSPFRLRGIDAEIYLTGVERRIDADRQNATESIERVDKRLEAMNKSMDGGFRMLGEQILPVLTQLETVVSEHHKNIWKLTTTTNEHRGDIDDVQRRLFELKGRVDNMVEREQQRDARHDMSDTTHATSAAKHDAFEGRLTVIERFILKLKTEKGLL